jgi:hypothetical protein
MAIDTSALEAVIKQSSRKLATKAVSGAKTAKLLMDNKAVTPGVKGTARINKMDADVNFQSGAGCGTRTALGGVTLTEKNISVTPIKDIQNICMDALYDTYYASLIAEGQDPEGENSPNAFINEAMDYRALKVAAQVEKLLWQGDKTLTGSNNLKFIDGFLVQIAAASDEIAITPTGSTVTAKLQSVYKAMPVEVRKADDFRIFISEELYDSYLIELDTANKFREATAFTLTGTSAKLEVTPGLNGTGKVVATKIDDLHLGVDGMSDADKVILKYSMETEQMYADFHFAVGVAVINTNQIGIASIAA